MRIYTTLFLIYKADHIGYTVEKEGKYEEYTKYVRPLFITT